MSEQPAQPQTTTSILVMQNEIETINRNRLYLLAILEDTKTAAREEIETRDMEISNLRAEVARLTPQPIAELPRDLPEG